jgi:hypothetical protein
MIAVIGAGPAGIYITKLLLDQGHKITLFESGNFTEENPILTRLNYKFETPSAMPKNIHRVGGGSNYWHARFGEFLEEDFEPIELLDVPGWPFGKSVLNKYYSEVAQDLGHPQLTENDFISERLSFLQNTINSNLDIRIFRFADKEIFIKMFETLRGHANLELKLNTFCHSIEKKEQPDSNSKLQINYYNNLNDVQNESYDKIIIAAGTFQSTALFLRSKKLHNKNNLLLAGKYLIDHSEGYIGEITIRKNSTNLLKNFLLNDENQISYSSSHIGVAIRLNSRIARDENLPSVHIEIRRRNRGIRRSPKEFKTISDRYLYFFERITKFCIEKIKEMIDFISRKETFGLYAKCEQFPTQDSFLEWNNDTNRLIHSLQISDKTKERIKFAISKLAHGLEVNFKSRVRLYDWLDPESQEFFFGANWHPMGTLRMGHDSKYSVCNSNLELHNQTNLFVLSPAVFPRGSNSNPIFTALALGRRLTTYLSFGKA